MDDHVEGSNDTMDEDGSNHKLPIHPQDHVDGGAVKSIDEPISNDTNGHGDLSNGRISMYHTREASNGDNTEYSSDGTENGELGKKDSELPEPFDIETNGMIWIPPKPEDEEDDMECSVANDDDDDDDNYSDGAKWDKSSSLGSFSKDSCNSFRLKEERHKAMVEVMNGHFRALVGQLLLSEGIPLNHGVDQDKSWLDIVTSLSWEAAVLVKPDANEGRAMDPGCYVKVKCVASGTRSQSEVIKGLVFKKNAAHKHMATKYGHPRLLLVRGVLGQRSSGLASFDSLLEHEKEDLRLILEKIELCQPNVVLVEKSASRDVQESLLGKGVTLVSDMKLQRLERIARCTGSQIVSSAENLMKSNLKQCDHFHIDRFVEEHGSAGEGGKCLNKTLMFFEGCPRPLGCTILLKGAHGDELKKVKRVMQYAVFAAYHLILEISFLVDQRAMFSNVLPSSAASNTLADKQMPSGCPTSVFSSNIHGPEALQEKIAQEDAGQVCIFHPSPVESSGTHHLDEGKKSRITAFNPLGEVNTDGNALDPPISSFAPSFDDGFGHPDKVIAYENVPSVLPDQLLSSLSSSIRKYLGESFVPPPSYYSISKYFGYNLLDLESVSPRTLSVSPSRETLASELPLEGGRKNEEQCPDEIHDGEVITAAISGQCENSDGNSNSNGNGNDNDVVVSMDATKPVMDPQSILVLLSSRCILKGTVCERGLLSRIKYYGSFDKSLGRFLHDNLLNQNHRCSVCGEPPEAHVLCYTHQNGRLTIFVKQLPQSLSLPGEADGKLWMWTRCLKCKRENGIPQATPRVVMSVAAQSLSFGKFLELSFSNHTAARRLASCGHSLHRDCLRFYGLGSKVALLTYSAVDVYGAYMPPLMLEISNPNGQEWLKSKAKNVMEKENLLFKEVENSIQKLKSQYSCSQSKYVGAWAGPVKGFLELEEMLRLDKSVFEASLQKAISRTGQQDRILHEIFFLNRLDWELMLLLYIWDRRLMFVKKSLSTAHSDARFNMGASVVQEPDDRCSLTDDKSDSQNCVQFFIDGEAAKSNDERKTLEIDCVSGPDFHANLEKDASLSSFDNQVVHYSQNFNEMEEVDVERLSEGTTICNELPDVQTHAKSTGKEMNHPSFETEASLNPRVHYLESDNSVEVPGEEHKFSAESGELNVPDPSASLADTAATTQISSGDHLGPTSNELEVERVPDSAPMVSSSSHSSLSENLENSESWVWLPFSESCKVYSRDLQRGFSPKFEFIGKYSPGYLSLASETITHEGSRLHFPTGVNDSVVSLYEDEVTSIIACALSLLQNQYNHSSDRDSNRSMDGNLDKETENLFLAPSTIRVSSIGSLDSLDTSEISSERSTSSEEMSTSGSDRTDSLLASKALHPEISLGHGRGAGKGKYSVVCLYAKEFDALRRKCYPAELDFISSLSRCKKWNAQGGKSKVFFAKTLDDRFIIKQVKRTEFDSFLKFAPGYFKHISHSFSAGNPTCLAKILGIYQVGIVNPKSGKDLKLDVMVMENLLFGRNVTRLYDLKGVLHSRYTSDAKENGKVLLDQNFVEDMLTSPLFMDRKAKHLLERAVWNDTSFLTSINVMDYSLLVGVDMERREFVFGIIDYMRQYTWDKHLETWVKASLVVPKNALPTVISPKEYKKRFRKAMSTYFLTVPDIWCPNQSWGYCDGSKIGCHLNQSETSQ
ncbi:putative 1-phosphatidylinositol-3-phosphate 5-kinase FAB1C isoform X2 [Amborella trichopoda]|uniref:putative 1-phosphatidylinositol-3-phosphate 5-kinase FAB1C isoform X2 n=1 Tax=Amborella trichopoda TaxID=13333 RepID=UPI0009BCA89B|nr:putative 1-phosphatidylinositol-3-phosphate 5-kinase FAB1C isoform X2 [Amborella trichopoda]|eukprot:XP_020532160.1 putative 1-phosphatidylinositol-3-phosphate 5-kinase FAB1C isoform X2 [Amborella trichopoda]